MSLAAIAKALCGEVVRGEVLAPGPGHSRADRSLSVKLSFNSPDGFLVHSFAGDDWRSCRDYVAERLGIVPTGETSRRREVGTNRRRIVSPGNEPSRRPDAASRPSDDDRIARAVAIWDEARDPRGTLVERYLASRRLDLPGDVSGAVLRYHPACPWREGDATIRVPCMVAAMRSIATDQITAVHRTRLTPDGAKVDRRMLGVAAGAAVKLDADDAVTAGLAIGEGIETCLAGRQLGFRPVWALASAGAVSSFPVLGGIEVLTILGENDPAGDRAASACGESWHAAGREVLIVEPRTGSDVNDAVRRMVA